jgi:hypothetical protein
LKDEKIQWQAARNSALTFVKLLSDAEALVLPTKKGEKADAIAALVEEKTQEYFQDVKDTVWKDGE